MIGATLRMIVLPEKREEFLRNIRGILEPTRVEPGCKSYHFYQDIENENAFILVEEWEAKASLDSHIHKDSYRILLNLMDLLSEPPQISFNTISTTRGMEYIGEVLGLDKSEKLNQN
ncbi:MAG: putative quinol monooxygenase [Ignavibacteriales bacterium]